LNIIGGIINIIMKISIMHSLLFNGVESRYENKHIDRTLNLKIIGIGH